MRPPILLHTPNECSPERLKTFETLVLKGGEVSSIGLARRIRDEVQYLAFVQPTLLCIGVGAMKRRHAAYVERIFRKANAAENPAQYPAEIGWIFLEPAYRGQRYSQYLIEELIDHGDGGGLYATVRTNNEPMQRTLHRLGFQPAGDAWNSTETPGATLSLLLR